MLRITNIIITLGLVVVAVVAGGSGRQHLFHSQSSAFESLSTWIDEQSQYAQARILSNIAPFADDASAMAGAVCASPSRTRPDYYYAWTRDSALVMNEILSWLIHQPQEESNSDNWRQWNIALDNYVEFTKHVQSLAPRLAYGLGEAKFHMDGSAFTKSWCNAQTDGPAIRALTLIRLAEHRKKHGSGGNLIDVIRVDLDYVSRVWLQNTHCDIWEESRGLHFYTAMAQHRALRAGAALLMQQRLGDTEASRRYQNIADQIELQLLPRFWNQTSNILDTTIEWSGGLSSKTSNLDTQVLLASLHFTHATTSRHHQYGALRYSVDSAEMVSTVLAILRRFEHMYDINSVATTRINGIEVPIGVAAGRYPEDVYNGVGTSQGNPWSLVTSALAEYHYRLALTYANAGYFVVSSELVALLKWTAPYINGDAELVDGLLQHQQQQVSAAITGSNNSDNLFLRRGLLSYLLAAGDLYMARVARHTANDHTMNEQWSAHTGFGRGAIHLTWSYAAHTAAARARSQLVSKIMN